MNTPYYDEIKKLSSLTHRFFMPGHKGNNDLLKEINDIAKFDMTEIEGADDLQHPEAGIMQSQNNMSKLYNTGASLYSAVGSTSCVEAMLTMFLSSGDTVIMGRYCHVSAVRALGFIGANPYWIYPSETEPVVTSWQVEKALSQTNAKAVYITSPDYFGHIADVKSIAEICHKNGAVLLVDNAHGAHLKFLSEDLHPITLGADACCDSAHKTLPCLTGASILHLKDESLAYKARKTLNLYCGTSPSFLILLSIDLACGKIMNGTLDFKANEKLCLDLRSKISWCEDVKDPFKIILLPLTIGYTTSQMNEYLKENDIYAEYVSDEKIVLMTSVGNTKEDFEYLQKILLLVEIKPKLTNTPFTLEKAESVCSVRKAVFGDSEKIKTEDSEGKIATSLIAPCPPGIPVVIPGEKITKKTLLHLINCGIFYIDVLK